MKRLLIISIGAILLQGCTSAGPFVTNISSDGNGGLQIEKCMVHMNAFMGTVSNDQCTTQNINITRRSRYQQDRLDER